MNRLALTQEEKRRLAEQGLLQQHVPETRGPGRPRQSSFKDEKPVCMKSGCFNYCEHNGDKFCRKHSS